MNSAYKYGQQIRELTNARQELFQIPAKYFDHFDQLRNLPDEEFVGLSD